VINPQKGESGWTLTPFRLVVWLSPMSEPLSEPTKHPRDPLHGITLEHIVTQLMQRHGWNEMGRRIPVRCFLFNPSVKSSLTFLRKTPWARQKIEAWFIAELGDGNEGKSAS
jgi:uncharacterized protein (DUF2132 family)